MTPAELQADCEKFARYLNENGVRVLAASMLVESGGLEIVAIFGANEMCAELAVQILCHPLGLKAVPK